MPDLVKQHLDTVAEKTVAELADGFRSPKCALTILEPIFPGITDRIPGSTDLGQFGSALGAEVGRSIKLMVDEGTEASLDDALLIVRGLRNLHLAKQLMGKKMIGPDARIFDGKDLGQIPLLPAKIIEVLRLPCPLSKDGRTVAETHRLTCVVNSIDHKPLTVNELRRFATEGRDNKNPVFAEERWWYAAEAFANKALETSTWVLEYETIAPKTGNKPDADQQVLVETLPHHRPAKLLEHLGTLVFQALENDERLFPNVEGRCQERSSKGSHLSAGSSASPGIRIYDYPPKVVGDEIGYAIVWNFDN